MLRNMSELVKFLLHHQILHFLGAMLLLVTWLDHRLAEKRGDKRDSIWPIGLGDFEMVFILLAETIAI